MRSAYAMDFQGGSNHPPADFTIFPQIHQIPQLPVFDFTPPLPVAPSPPQAQWQPAVSYYDASRQPAWYHPTQHQRRTAFVDGQMHRHFPRPAEARPRLTKDETEILEMAFAVNQKPSTVVKRDIANRLAVNLAKVNNWFQNRRAKEKTIIKSREAEKRRAMERAASETATSPDDKDSTVVSQYYLSGDSHQPVGPSSAVIGEEEQECGETKTETSDSGRSTTASRRTRKLECAILDSEGANEFDSDQSAGTRSEESTPVHTPLVSETHSSPQVVGVDGLSRADFSWARSFSAEDSASRLAPEGLPHFQNSPASPYQDLAVDASFAMGGGELHPHMNDFSLHQLQGPGEATTQQFLYPDFSSWDYFSSQPTPPFSSGAASEAPSDEHMMAFLSTQNCQDFRAAIDDHSPPSSISAGSLAMNGLGIC